MDFDKVILITKCFAEIEKETGGKFFINTEEKNCLVGVVVLGIKYNQDKVYKKLNSLKKKTKIKEYNHIMVGENVILVQFSEE